MKLKFKDPQKVDLKKVMIYGLDGTGKSTLAANYCCEHNLHPIVIDIDDTNRTRLYSEGKVLDLDLSNDVKAFNNINSSIKEIKRLKKFDTIIIDGVTSLLDMLVSDSGGMAKYSDRALRFNKILQTLLSSGKHLIFIGQIDMEVHYNEKNQSSRAVIKVNSLVNEKYLCEADMEKNKFWHTKVKNRTIEEIIEDESTVPETTTTTTVSKTTDDPIHNICMQIKLMLEKEGKMVNKSTMKSKVIKLINEGTLPKDNRPVLIKYIQKHCPEELD